jgi:A/G-specific adenine glycosylase
MLQQTTVATVTGRFSEWMLRFPRLADLAKASEQEVLSAWEGLGYYSRARRLHAAAQGIVEKHGGIIPDSSESLLELPGVGAYTAAAILAFAYDKPAVVLDTNIIRVLARWGNLMTPVDTTPGKKLLGNLADEFFPKSGCRNIASALMDLGATLCKAGKPECAECPLRPGCSAVTPEGLPKKSPRRVTTKITEHRAWIHQAGKLSLEQSEGPRWRGLWILPPLGEAQPSGRPIMEISYPITRYRVSMKVYPVKGSPSKELYGKLRGFTPQEIEALPIPTPHRKAIEKALRAIAAK